LKGAGAGADLRQVMIEPDPQPRVRRAPDRFLKPHRHFRRDAGWAANDPIKLLRRHAEICCRLGDAQAKGRDIVFQSCARMGRTLHRQSIT